MGQKVNPHGFRVGVIKGWDSRWFARDNKVGDLIVEDDKIRKLIKKKLYVAGVPRIEIERDNTKVRIFIHCARPGQVIGRQGADIEKLRADIEKMIGKTVAPINIVEVKTPDLCAQLVAENIASQLEKRISFRRAMKQSMGRAMRMGARGIKTAVSGRLGGAEIARSEHYHEGTIPLQTLRADIDYGFAEAATTYGRIGVKVWIYKGEVLTVGNRMGPRTIETGRPRDDRRRDDRRPERRGGNDRSGGGYNNNRGPRPAGQGGYGNRSGGQGGGYSSGPRPAGQGGYSSGPRPAGQGGYNSGPRPAGQGGYSSGPRPAGQGGYNSAPRPAGQGGYNNNARPAGQNTPRPASTPRPAAPAAPRSDKPTSNSEGGTQ